MRDEREQLVQLFPLSSRPANECQSIHRWSTTSFTTSRVITSPTPATAIGSPHCVLRCKLVPFTAMGSCRVMGRVLSDISQIIHKTQVARVHTTSVTTHVIAEKPVRNRAN